MRYVQATITYICKKIYICNCEEQIGLNEISTEFIGFRATQAHLSIGRLYCYFAISITLLQSMPSCH